MLFVLFLTSAMSALAVARFGGVRGRVCWALFYASVALATLTKGPVACAVAGGAVLLFWAIDLEPRRLLAPRALWADFRAMLSTYRVGLGSLVFVAVAGPWYGLMLFRHGRDFIDYFFVDENIQRFGTSLFGHAGNSTYYVLSMLHGMFPWISLLPLALPLLFHGSRRLDDDVRQRWYFAAWALSVFLIFSAASTKLDHYIFPMAPAVAVLVALVWERVRDPAGPYWLRPLLLLSLAVVLLAVRDVVEESNGFLMNSFAPYQPIGVGSEGLELALWLVLAGWVVAVAAAVLSRRATAPFALAVLVAYGNGVYLSHHVLPAHTPERTLKGYVDLYRQVREPDAVLAYFGKLRYSTHYYLGKHEFVQFDPDEIAGLIEFVRDRPHVYVISQDLYADPLLERLHAWSGKRWTILADDHPQFQLLASRPLDAAGGG
jgi:4-amino-4-deoxy-L-arabinose transferase-like glycosyltransferase